jgi:hypothetical protein
MRHITRPVGSGLLLCLYVLSSAAITACNGEPHEGFYDREHHRWYHEHRWQECVEHDAHCG